MLGDIAIIAIVLNGEIEDITASDRAERDSRSQHVVQRRASVDEKMYDALCQHRGRNRHAR